MLNQIELMGTCERIDLYSCHCLLSRIQAKILSKMLRFNGYRIKTDTEVELQTHIVIHIWLQQLRFLFDDHIFKLKCVCDCVDARKVGLVFGFCFYFIVFDEFFFRHQMLFLFDLNLHLGNHINCELFHSRHTFSVFLFARFALSFSSIFFLLSLHAI